MKDVVADLHLGLKELAAEDRDGWSPLALSDRLRDVVGLRERSEVEVIRTVALWDRRTAWAEDGAVTAISWVKHHLGLPQGEAAGLVRLARLYDQHPTIADALDGALLSLAQLRLLARAERAHRDMFAACLDGFLDMAAKLTLPEFAEVLASWADLLDEDEPPDPEKRSWKSGEAGTLGRGVVNTSAENLAIINAAIEALDTLDPADCPEGPRSREQRHHDIVIDIFRRALADQLGDDPSANGGVEVIVDADTAAELVAKPEPDDDSLWGDGEDPLAEVLRPYREADLATLLGRRSQRVDGGHARRTFVAALMCSGFIRRIIRDPRTGNVLDVGRAQRLFTKRQIRALVIRDGGCVFPGCDRKPKWCDAHHLKPWEDEGDTDLDNGCLLCRRHHSLIHGGWTLQRDPRTGVVTATAPDGRQFTRRPNERC